MRISTRTVLIMAAVLSTIAVSLNAVTYLHAAGPNYQQEVRAKRFVLVNNAGDARVILQSRPDGGAGIELYTASGHKAGQFVVNGKEDCYLSLFDEGGKTRAEVGYNARGRGGLWTYGPDGHIVTWSSVPGEVGQWEP